MLGTGPVAGTFAGLPQGSTVSVPFGGTTYNLIISYTGGDGNDITLTSPAGVPSGVEVKGSNGFRKAVASPQTR